MLRRLKYAKNYLVSYSMEAVSFQLMVALSLEARSSHMSLLASLSRSLFYIGILESIKMYIDIDLIIAEHLSVTPANKR